MPLPTSEESEVLSLYFKDIENSPYSALSPEQESELYKKIRDKNDVLQRRKAIDTLVLSNLRFVVSVARNYQNQGVPLSDLINEGNIGLIKAAERFDATKDFKFISYAVWWIRQRILQAISDQSRVTKLPLNRTAAIYKVLKAIEKLKQKYHSRPSIDQIADEMDMSHNEVVEILHADSTSISYDHPLYDSKSSLSEVLADSRVDVEGDIMRSFSKDIISKALNTLAPREKQILMLYYGFDNNCPRTLDEIGKHLKLTRERVRQIKEKAHDRLRKSLTARKLLKDHFD